MIMASAKALAALSPAMTDPNAPLLPPIGDSRRVAMAVAEAVGKAAISEGLSMFDDGTALMQDLLAYVWEPVYLPYERVD